MHVLDVRYAKKNPEKPTALVGKKVRKEGTPSDCLPPPNAPSWAVKDNIGNNNN